jgi:protein disulfide-isomerase A6
VLCCDDADLATLKAVAKKNRRLYSFVWTEAGAQPGLERSFDGCCAGYPTLVAVSGDKGRFAQMRDAFDEKNAHRFVGGVLSGRERTQPAALDKAAKWGVEEVSEWDGKDGELPEEEPLDSYDDVELDA